ncbi:MAG: Mur ligase family protein [Candidatus Gracilibacteria bacterium]|nr:Mur ligase family protein [Candidatus Gracilibacteria bacterium]
MNSNFTLLFLLSILPLLNKYLFWFFSIQLKEYRFDRFFEYIGTIQGKKAIFNFWFFIEIPVLIFTIGYFINPLIENTIYKVVIYLLLLQSFFVISKAVKRKLIYPKVTSRLIFTAIILLIIELIFIYFTKNIYFFILFNLCFPFFLIFLSVFFSLPIVNKLKNKIIFEAKMKSKVCSHPIKIGITGSYGKSSVKEYLSQILEKNNKVLSTPKNVNTELGVSDLINKKLKDKYDYFIAEMGAYKAGEIATLGEIVDHKYAFITAIGNQHLALFGGIKNIIKGKSEIASKVLENKGTLYINGDDKNISKAKFNKKTNIVTYGIKEKCDAKSDIIEIKKAITKFDFYYKGTKTTYKTNLLGSHNIINITGVLAFCYDLGIDKETIKTALLDLKMPSNTLDIIKFNNSLFLDDTYNLSEGGLFAGLEVLNSFSEDNGKRILIMDDILELGKESDEIHFEIGKKIAKKKLVDKVFYVGINNKTDFINGLVSGGFKINNIVENLDGIRKNDVLLFEGRKSQLQLKKLIGKKQ